MRCVILLLVCGTAQADVVTEFGMGYKAATSFLLNPTCKTAAVTSPKYFPENPRGVVKTPYGERGPWGYSCGGDNPAFIGWPVAWESDWKGPWRVRAGWFHFSHWFDGGELAQFGGDKRETHMDILAVTATFNWTRWKNR